MRTACERIGDYNCTSSRKRAGNRQAPVVPECRNNSRERDAKRSQSDNLFTNFGLPQGVRARRAADRCRHDSGALEMGLMHSLDAPKRRSVPSRRISLAGAVLVGVTIIAAGLTIWDRHEESIASYRREINNLGTVLAEQTARSMQAVDLVVKEVQAKVLAAGADNPEDFKRIMGTEAIHRFLVSRQESLPQADSIGLIGADGMLINGARSWPVPFVDLSDRDYFTHFRDNADADLFIGAPRPNRLSGAWTFFVGRRVSGPHGEFLGVLIALIEGRYFEEFYKAIDPQGGSIAIWRADGTLIARYPHAEAMMGKKLASASSWYEAVAKGGGTYRTPGYIDGMARVVSVHSLHDYPLVVTVTISEDAALADWRRQSILIAIAALCAAVGFAVLFWALAGRSRKLEQQTAELATTADALRRSEARFRDFARTSSDWFWETDEQHRFTYVSDELSLFGQDPRAAIGRTRSELAADRQDDIPRWEEHYAGLDRHEPFRNFVYGRKIGTSPERIVSVSGNPVFDPSERFLGYRGTARDVTEEILAERGLREAKSAAEAANRAKSQFLANMSHELRTPLNAVLGFSEILAQQLAGPLRANQVEYVDMIYRSGRHLHDIINDILDLAKVDAGKLDLNPEDGIDPCAVVNACVALIKERASAGGLQLSVNFDPVLPLIVADAMRLKQILLNLLSNAVKFTEPGGSIVITVREPGPDTIAFDVRDTGVGMSEAEIKIALEPFGQVDAGIARRHEGTGLGLPLARRLAELHGGSLHIESRKGRGTTATLTLPVCSALLDISTAAPTAALSTKASAA
jgi:PAS domain S-box-containing protein